MVWDSITMQQGIRVVSASNGMACIKICPSLDHIYVLAVINTTTKAIITDTILPTKRLRR